MSLDTYDSATLAILQKAYTTWNDGRASTLLGYQPEMLMPDNEQSFVPDWNKHWARTSIQTVIEPQATLSCCVGENGKRRYETQGLCFVQIFSPKTNEGMKQARQLAIIARSAFRGQRAGNSIVFRNARIQDGLAPEVNCFRFNVVTEYEYDESN